MTRPTKITPDPIINAVAEFRFESEIPPDAILGMLFNVVRDTYPNFQKLPIADIPEEIRMNDPQLKYAPCYQAVSGGYQLNVGSRVVSLSIQGDYKGWRGSFFPALQYIIEKLKKSGIIKNFTRIGLRYIDFFETDIFDKITLSISLNNKPLVTKQKKFSALFEHDDLLTRVNIQNNSIIRRGEQERFGSIIDTDTFLESACNSSFEELTTLIDKQHEISLTVFYDLLEAEFLKTLNPEYNNV